MGKQERWHVPVFWTTTPEGSDILAEWRRLGLISEETPWLRDLAEAIAERWR